MNWVNKKDMFGKSLLILSIAITMFLICNSNFLNLNWVFTHIDEYFTLGFIKFPINELITITANDVHPPLYYLMLKVVTKLSYITNLSQYNMLFIRYFSLIPYLIIIVLSITKVKDKYGWLTAGILSFSLLTMSEFSYIYFFIRMYSWAMLFTLLAFMSIKEILENNKKYWILLTIFAILCAYTHYYAAMSLIVIYISLLCYFIITKNYENLKLGIISAIIGIVSYIPWALILINQLKSVHDSFWIEPINFLSMIDLLSYFAVKQDAIFYVKIFSTLILIAIIVAIAKKYMEKASKDNMYLVLGVLTFLGTLLICLVISFLFKPILITRYLIIPIGVMWFAVSIYIGEIEDKKILGILIALILVFGFMNLAILNSYSSQYAKGIEDHNFLEGISDEGNVTIICIDKESLIMFGTYLKNCNVYSTITDAYGLNMEKFNETSKVQYVPKEKISRLIDETNDTVYIIKRDSSDLELDNYNMENVKQIHALRFIKVEK